MYLQNLSFMYQLQSFQIDLHEVAQEIENNSPPVEILRSLVQSTESLHHHGSSDLSLADELSSEENLADVSSWICDLSLVFVKGMHGSYVSFSFLQEFMQMLRNDVSQRFKDKEGK